MAANTTVRLTDDTVERLEKIAAELSRRAEGIKVTTSDALRTVLFDGLPVTEKKLGLK